MLEELNRAPPLPYIPPPDYTMRRNHPAAQRSSRTPQYSAIFQSDSTQFSAAKNKDDPGKPHRYVPPISPPRRRPPLMEAVSRIESYGKGDANYEINDHRHHLSHNNNSAALQGQTRNNEFRSKEDRVKRMLQEQGVPVFPGLPQSSKADQNLGPTKAYIKHLENHRKYDTLNSYRSCENCQLCRQMEQEMGHFSPANHEKHQHAHDYNQIPHHSKANAPQAPITSSRFFEPLVEEEPTIDADNIQTTSTEKDRRVPKKSDIFQRPMAGPHRSITDSQYTAEPLTLPSSARSSNPDRMLPVITPNWTPMSERKVAPAGQSSPAMMRANTILSKSLHNVSATASANLTKPTIGLVPTAAASALSVVVGPQVVRAKKSRKAKTAQELSMCSGEILKVLESGPNWVRCLNRQGQSGWVPRKDTQPCN
ncbi:SH3 domain-containing protein [Ditylenchus destructor]|nr:SH3 domain-containing protein [Ditylenchus destructor]